MSYNTDIDRPYIPSRGVEQLPPAYEALRRTMPVQAYRIGRIGQEIPITHRGPAALAAIYGFNGIDDFSQELPTGAQVLDVGSGISTLGLAVARRRPDVRWVNADIAYSRPEIREALETEVPDNLELVAADVLDLSAAVGEQKFDRVFSYYLLRHIVLASSRAGRSAIEQVMQTVKPETGTASLGPVRARYVNVGVNQNQRRAGDAIQLTAPSDPEDLEKKTTQVVKAIRVTPFGITQRLMNGFRIHRSKLA